MLGVTADQLCTVYRTQFAVLYGYDHQDYVYDANGRLVPNAVLTVWRKKGERMSVEERTATNQAGNTYTIRVPFPSAGPGGGHAERLRGVRAAAGSP